MTNQVPLATSYLLKVIHKLESTQIFLFLGVQDESASVSFRWRKYSRNINWEHLHRIIKRWEMLYSPSTHKVKHTHTSVIFLDLFFLVAAHFRMRTVQNIELASISTFTVKNYIPFWYVRGSHMKDKEGICILA